MLTCPAKHLVHDRLDEEDEEEPDAEEQLGERIFQLQQCRWHHPHVGGTFQGLPHLFKDIFIFFKQIHPTHLAQHVDEHSGDENAASETQDDA